MLKKWSIALMFALLLILAAGAALADGQINPKWQEMQHTLRTRQRERTDALEPDAVRVTLECQSTPTLDDNGSFSATILNGEGGSYVVRFGITDSGRDDGGYIYYGDCSDVLTFDGVQILSTGEYEAWVFVYSASDTDHYLDYDYWAFTVTGPETASLEYRTSQLVSQCRGADDWHTALNLHDWLTHNAYYDLNYEYYGADIMFRGKGVCDSYSKAFKMLCNAAGIQNQRVTSNRMHHAWNALVLGGKWYLADVTWDDPSGALEAVSGQERYNYFCLNDELMYLDHERSDISFDPGCTSLDAQYHIHENRWEEFCQGKRFEDGELVMYSLMEDVQSELNSGKTSVDLEWTKTVFSITHSSSGSWSSSFRYVTEAQYRIVACGMNRRVWSLSDGSAVRASAVHADGSSSVTLTVSGWDIEETGTLVLPDDLQEIGEDAFQYEAATRVVIPAGVTSIGPGAFAHSAVRTVVFMNPETEISPTAFGGCGRLMFIVSGSEGNVIDFAGENGCLVVAQP